MENSAPLEMQETLVIHNKIESDNEEYLVVEEPGEFKNNNDSKHFQKNEIRQTLIQFEGAVPEQFEHKKRKSYLRSMKTHNPHRRLSKNILTHAAKDLHLSSVSYHDDTPPQISWLRLLVYVPLLIGALLIVLCARKPYRIVLWEPEEENVPYYPLSFRQIAIQKHHSFKVNVEMADKYNVDHSDLMARVKARREIEPDVPDDAAHLCVAHFGDQVRAELGNNTMTRVEDVKFLLGLAYLNDFHPAVLTLGSMLTEPQDLAPLIDKIETCSAQNAMYASFACHWKNNPSITPSLQIDGEAVTFASQVRLLLTRVLMMDRLTEEAYNNHQFFADSFYAMAAGLQAAGGPELYHRLPLAREQLEFIVDKYNTILKLARDLVKARNQRQDLNKWGREVSTQINIMEAVLIDTLVLKNEANALTGIALAHYVSGRGSSINIHEADSGNSEYRWPLGKDWADAYIAWYTDFVIGGLSSVKSVPKLLIPGMFCTSDDFAAQSFILKRLYSLFLHMNMNANPDNEFLQFMLTPALEQFALDFGKITNNHLPIRLPTAEDVKEMLIDWPTPYLSSFIHLGPYGWKLILTFSCWGSVVLAGFGMEYFMLGYVFKYHRVTTSAGWQFAQIIFPMLLSVALLSHSVFSFPILAVGLWKLGFPETLSDLVASLTLSDDPSIGFMRALASYCNVLGTVLHHSATVWYCCALTFDLYEEVPIYYVLGATLPLVFQHWFIMLKYKNLIAFVVIELALEIWWEIEQFSLMDKCRFYHQQRCLWAILVAHWFYWTAGVINFILDIYLAHTLPHDDSPAAESHRRKTVHHFEAAAETLTAIVHHEPIKHAEHLQKSK